MVKFSIPKFSFPRLPFPTPGLAKKENVLILEIGEEWIKLAGIEGGVKKETLTCLGAEAVPGLSELESSQKIGAFLKSKSFKPAHVVMSHPAHQLTTRILALPSTDPKEIKDILDLQAVKQTPYAKEEITLGFRILGSDTSGYSRVLLAISHRDVALRYFRIAELANLPVEKMTLSIEGTIGWYRRTRAKEAVEGGQVVLLLDMDWLSTDFLIFRGENILFTRSLGLGAKHLKEGGATREGELLREIQLSMESGQAELKGECITHVALAGMGESFKDLLAALSRELNLPCEVVGSLPAIKESLSFASGVDIPQEAGSFSSILGLALDHAATPINLVPSEIEVRRELEGRAKDLGFFGTLLLILIMLISVSSFIKIYKRSQYLHTLRREYASIEKSALEVERVVAKMKLAQEQMSARAGFLDVLQDVSHVLSNNTYLHSIQFQDQDRAVTFRGVSEEMSSVFQLLSTLEGTPHLEAVKTRNVTKTKMDEKDMSEFEIVATITEPANETAMKASTVPAGIP